MEAKKETTKSALAVYKSKPKTAKKIKRKLR
jgi:hypothetical protein